MSHPSEWTCFANSTDGRNVWQITVFLNVSDGHPIVSIIIAVVFGVSAVVGILLTVLVAFWLKKRRTLTEPDAESQPDTPRQAPPAPFLQSPESRQDPSVESLEMMPVRGAASEQPTSSDLVETAAPVPSSEEQGPTEAVERPSSEEEPSEEAAAVSLPPEDTATEVSQPGGEPMGQQAPQGDHQDLAAPEADPFPEAPHIWRTVEPRPGHRSIGLGIGMNAATRRGAL